MNDRPSETTLRARVMSADESETIKRDWMAIDWSRAKFVSGQPNGDIRPNKLRDLHVAIKDDMTDAEFRATVMKWLEDVAYAE